MALEPAIGMAVGAAVLTQTPSSLQVMGIALVVIAGVGVTRTGE